MDAFTIPKGFKQKKSDNATIMCKSEHNDVASIFNT